MANTMKSHLCGQEQHSLNRDHETGMRNTEIRGASIPIGCRTHTLLPCSQSSGVTVVAAPRVEQPRSGRHGRTTPQTCLRGRTRISPTTSRVLLGAETVHPAVGEGFCISRGRERAIGLATTRRPSWSWSVSASARRRVSGFIGPGEVSRPPLLCAPFRVSATPPIGCPRTSRRGSQLSSQSLVGAR